jgi:hypothetical protein
VLCRKVEVLAELQTSCCSWCLFRLLRKKTKEGMALSIALGRLEQ